MGLLVSFQCGEAGAERNLFENSLAFPTARFEKPGLSTCDALQFVELALLAFFFLDRRIRLRDEGGKPGAEACDPLW